MLEDLPNIQGIADAQRDPAQFAHLLRERGVDFVTVQDWKTLDQHEASRGATEGRPRVKVTTVPEMLEVIRKGR